MFCVDRKAQKNSVGNLVKSSQPVTVLFEEIFELFMIRFYHKNRLRFGDLLKHGLEDFEKPLDCSQRNSCVGSRYQVDLVDAHGRLLIMNFRELTGC